MQGSVLVRSTLIAAFAMIALGGCAGVSPHIAPLAVTSSSTQAEQVNRTALTWVDTRGLLSMAPPRTYVGSSATWRRYVDPNPTGGKSAHAWVTTFGFPLPVNLYKIKMSNKANMGPICATPPVTGVTAMAVDHAGHLWLPVGNNVGGGYTQEYDCKGPYGLNIPSPLGQPADVGFDRKDDVYVLHLFDYDSQQNDIPGTVSAYKPDGSLIGKLSDPSFLQLVGIGVDAHDNCFVSGYSAVGGQVVEFPRCAPAKRGIVLKGPNLGYPGKPQFDAAGNLVIADAGLTFKTTLNIYAPPFNTPPAKKLSLYSWSIMCPFGPNGARFYCASLIDGAIDVYSYHTGKYLYSFNNGMDDNTGAVAIAPAFFP